MARFAFLAIGTAAAMTLACSGSGSPTSPASDTSPPTVTITSPLAGGVTGVVVLQVTATDDRQVAYVRFKVNGGLVATIDSGAPYSYSWDTSLFAIGSYDWQAVAADGAGNSATSEAVTYTIGP